MSRVFLLVLDSVGCGQAPDAAAFGDAGSSTLGHLYERMGDKLRIPNLLSLGLGNATGGQLPRASLPLAAHGALTERSAAKDTVTGHWELCGVVTPTPPPTYPEGFPPEVIARLTDAWGVSGVLGNCPASGTQIIQRLGREHVDTGLPIVYTSGDSVLQIACHEAVIPLTRLYAMCEQARRIMAGPHAVGRIIARPFIGGAEGFTRTENRRDYALEPPAPTLLDRVSGAGQAVIAIGKIFDIFAGRGVTQAMAAHDNAQATDAVDRALGMDFDGLAMANLVDFDMRFGHRRDVAGYAQALMDFDRRLPGFLAGLRPHDLLVLTADHGCDPTFRGTDHTRERVPVLLAGPGVRPENLGVRGSFCDLAQTLAQKLGVPPLDEGVSFFDQIN
ncbi:MAG: phosphopentomutase [Christensenellales bacterium]|jgi:phosphopentomutase